MTTFAHHTGVMPAASETRLLALFAPTTADRRQAREERGRDLVSLWHVDAVHRAKNMAQLSISLANIVTHPADHWGAAETAAPALALARSYEALSLDNESMTHVPCFEMVSDVAIGLATIFGRARNIGVQVSGREVFATPEHRRALTLMCSELVINALKYAFPTGGPGTIVVRIAPCTDGIELIVSDNGHGLQGDDTPGEGKGLLDRLARVSGATLRRSIVSGGTGLQVTITVPLAAPARQWRGDAL